MIKKILLLMLTTATVTMSFAFSGVINQTYTDVNTKEQKEFVWYIDNDKVRFEVISGEEKVILIPDFNNLSLTVFGNKADANGDNYYTKTSVSNIQVSVPKLRILEQSESNYNGQEAKEIKLMGNDGLLVVQYLNSIKVNMKNMLTFFAESSEFQAISLTGDSGFPVSSLTTTSDEAVYTLTTKSIEEKSLSSALFSVPTNYKLFDANSLKK